MYNKIKSPNPPSNELKDPIQFNLKAIHQVDKQLVYKKNLYNKINKLYITFIKRHKLSFTNGNMQIKMKFYPL